MQNKNIVTKKVIYGITGLTLLILAISLGTQTPSSAQVSPEMNGNNNNTTIFENNAFQGQNYIKLLAQDMENHLEKAATILELTGMLPEVKNLTSVNMLDEPTGQLKGIPQNADVLKRQVAKDILEKYGQFQVVFFLMPNGDIYIEEPFSLQKNLAVKTVVQRIDDKKCQEGVGAQGPKCSCVCNKNHAFQTRCRRGAVLRAPFEQLHQGQAMRVPVWVSAARA